jgi:hypothetical protein
VDQPASFDSLEQIEGVLELIEPELPMYVYNWVPAQPRPQLLVDGAAVHI